MPRIRRDVTVRLVPLGSREAGDARVAGTPEQRLRVLAELSELSWTLSRKPLPSYSRSEMPVVVVPLGSGKVAK